MYRADKVYGAARQVLANISLSFLPGAKIGVLGANGAGKSTLLRIMAGKEETSSGAAELAPGATVGLLEQEPELDPAKTVRENVEDGVRAVRDLLDRFNAISAAFAEPDADFDALLEEQGRVQEQIDRADAWGLDAAIDRAMDALRLPDGDRDVVPLSGGERRRVALCRLLLASPDLLLLDEPTNHLDAESVAWLERFLAEYKGTVVAVTHDRYFLDNVAGWILELDRGRGIPFEGNYSSWLEQKQARLAAEEKTESARRRRVGDTVQLAYVDQSRAGLDPQSTVWKEISGGADTIELGRREVNSRQYTSWFNFKGPDQQKRVGNLSGGERNRVHLAKLLRSGGNVLLLDEPTNDLDVDTLRALEEALNDFAGCAVVITHDRWFLDRVATHILAFEGDSTVTWFEGSWADYAEWRGPEALEPHRIKYKPLVRA